MSRVADHDEIRKEIKLALQDCCATGDGQASSEFGENTVVIEREATAAIAAAPALFG
jgi:hypothetical protein